MIPPRVGLTLLLVLVVLPGIAGVVVFGYYALVDWRALQEAYHYYTEVALSASDVRALMVAEADQNIHRINLFADGVWALLSAILAAIGLHGVCVLGGRRGQVRFRRRG